MIELTATKEQFKALRKLAKWGRLDSRADAIERGEVQL